MGTQAGQGGQGRGDPGRPDGHGRHQAGRQDRHPGPHAPPGGVTAVGRATSVKKAGRRPRAAAKKAAPSASGRTRKPPADQRGPPPARHRARATGPRPHQAGGPGRHRRRPRPRLRRTRPRSRRASSPRASRSSSSDPPSPFVSRGGLKLDAALTRFRVAVTGRRALDAGASTGGFTDCLLQRGAAHVYAVDVGHGQLHPALRADPRVTRPRAHERPDAHARPTCARPTPPTSRARWWWPTCPSSRCARVVPALAGPLVGARCRPRPPGEAPVRGGPRRGLPGQGRRCATRRCGCGALEGVASALDPRRNRHHGSDGLPPDRRRRQRRVPGARPQGTRRASPQDEAAALFAAAVSEAEDHLPPAAPAD